MNYSQKFIAQVKPYKGTPTVWINDHPILLASAGLVCHRDLPFSTGDTDPPIVSLLWPPEACWVTDSPDMERITKRFETMFTRFPNALGGLVIGLRVSSSQWAQTHQEEMTKFEKPYQGNPASDRWEPSWASKVWQRESGEFLRAIVSHLHEVFRGRIVYYQVGCGHCGENYPMEDALAPRLWLCGDFSKPMVKWFREKIREYYSDDVEELRRSWNRPDVTFATALPPSRMERLHQEWFTLRSPQRQWTTDYYKAWSEAVEECVLLWAEQIREATHGESVIASPMGSVLDFGLNSLAIHQLKKNSYRRCLKVGEIDMFQSPASYAFRDPGSGDTSSMIPLGSLRLHGKIWSRDFDSRTSLVEGISAEHPVGSLWKTPSTLWQDVQILTRDAAYSIIKGGSWWWHEINKGMYSHARHKKTIKQLWKVAAAAVHADRTPEPGLGVFMDSRSNFCMTASNRLSFAMNYEARQRHWSHAGMSCEIYDMPDVSHPDLPSHKVIMVTNAFAIDVAEAQSLIKLARQNNGVVIWLMAPGVIGGDDYDVEATSTITGIKICAKDVEIIPHVTICDFNPKEKIHPWIELAKQAEDFTVGFGGGRHDMDDSGARCCGPVFYADVNDDPQAVVCGHLTALHEPGLVIKPMDGYTSIYCSAPYLHKSLLRACGQYWGAHIYQDNDDLIHVSKELILIHANHKGTKRIRWPRKVEAVIDLFSGRTIDRDCDHWTLNMKSYETRFLFAGRKEEAKQIRMNMRRNSRLREWFNNK